MAEVPFGLNAWHGPPDDAYPTGLRSAPRELYSEHPPRLEYHLTDKGRSLGPVMKALREWGKEHA